MVGAMRSFWKVLLGLALVLPLGAYVAGSLVASASDDPEPRNPLIIEQSGPPPGTRSPRPTGPSGSPDDGTDDAEDDGTDDDGGNDGDAGTTTGASQS